MLDAPTRRIHPAVCLFLGLSLLFLALAPTAAQAQSARFDQFAESSPKTGEMAPGFTLMTLDNEPFDLMEAVAEMPLVIEFGSFT